MNADSLLHWLMRTSLEASVLILAVLGLRWVLGQRLSPAWRIGLWMLVGAKLLLPAFVPAGFGLGAWMQQHSPAPAVTPKERVLEDMPQEETAALSAPLPDGSGTKTSWSLSPKVALVWVWLLGTAAILLTALVRQRRFAALLRSRPPGTAPVLRALVASVAHRAGVRKDVRIALMPAGTTPAMVGIRQPTLLLPEDWQERFDERSLRHVVAHELFHVKQGDLVWNWIALAVQAVHWFNPLVWLVVSRFQADRELRCDAGALSLLAPTERLEYGHTLLRIQETFFAPPAIAGLAPCVRNHPTLRQRILMIATPTTRQPWLQALLVVTLGGLVCYSFTTTARAQEKEVPPKVRTRDSERNPAVVPGSGGADGVKKPGDREREGDGAARRPSMREGDGERKAGARDGDGERKPGMRDGERSRTGERDGEKPRTGEREGDGAARRPGMREGDGERKAGARDGDGERKPGMRDGERSRTGERDGEKPRTGMRDGERPRTGEGDGKPREGRASESAAASSSGETITLHVTKSGELVRIGEEEISMGRLRGHLSNLLPAHPGARVIVTGDADVPLGALHNTVDAVRDNGNKNVGIKPE